MNEIFEKTIENNKTLKAIVVTYFVGIFGWFSDWYVDLTKSRYFNSKS